MPWTEAFSISRERTSRHITGRESFYRTRVCILDIVFYSFLVARAHASIMHTRLSYFLALVPTCLSRSGNKQGKNLFRDIRDTWARIMIFHRHEREAKVKPTDKRRAKLNGDLFRGNERTSSSDVVPVRWTIGTYTNIRYSLCARIEPKYHIRKKCRLV